MPKVSVVMSVYNAEPYLEAAIDSILNQTFRDFEFVIVDDGSTDGSTEILEKYAKGDSRIRLVHNAFNKGLIRSLNRGVKLAKGEYIARQDGDDVSLPQRLASQVQFLDEHPEIGVHSARAVARRGAVEVAEDVVVQLQSVDAVYVTLDIDALDPAYAPGTGTPEAGGLSTRQLLELLRVIFAELPVRALDIVEVSPPLDCADITSFAAAKVVYETSGWVKARLTRQ